MLAKALGRLPLLERIKHAAYCTLYANVQLRLCVNKEEQETDFFTALHQGSEKLVQRYRERPTAVRCHSRGQYRGNFIGGDSTYLVVGGQEKLVLLLPPGEALLRNLPYLAVLEGNIFKPHLGCASTYWQTWIEPDSVCERRVVVQSNKLALMC